MKQQETVFGLHAVQTLIKRSPKRIRALWIQQGRIDRRMQALLEQAQRAHLKIQRVERRQLDEQAGGVHQGVVALCEAQRAISERELDPLLDSLQEPPFLLVLDGVTDPHNLGACLRSADAAGIHAVIAPKDKSAPLNATASKVACGAAETLPYVTVTNLARTLRDLQQRGIWLVGAAGEAEQSLYQTDLTGALALVMGAEGSGLRRLTREHCDHLVYIPMAGEVSSLNVSVATGISLFEAVRQRQLQPR